MNNKHILHVALIGLTILGISGFVLSHVEGFSQAGQGIPQGAIDTQATQPTSSGPLVLTDRQQRYGLGTHLQILEDPTRSLTIDDVSSPAYEGRFSASTVEVPNYGYTNNAVWVRISLDNETQQTNEWLLEDSYPNTQYIDLYSPLPNGNGYDISRTGALRPVSTRDVLYPNIVFDLNIPAHSQLTYYLHIQSGASMTIPLTLWTKNAFISASGQSLIFHWLVFGGFLALLIYHLFLLIKIRERTYLYFVAMLASMMVFFLIYTGFMWVYIFPNLADQSAKIIPFVVAAMYASIILFSDSFLELSTRLPAMHKLNLGLLAVWGVLLLLVPFVSYLSIARLMTPYQMITITVTFVIGVIAWWRGFRPAGFFMLAWLGMGASLFLFLLVRMGFAPSNYLNENIFILGFIMTAVSWSIALADRISMLQVKTESTSRDLRSTEHKLAQILEALPLGIVVYNRDQKPTYINKRTSEIIGNPHSNIQAEPGDESIFSKAMGRFSFWVAGSDQQYPPEKTPLYSALNGIAASTDNIEMTRGDERVPLEIWASPIKNDDGGIDAAVAVFQDITQRKQAEAELIQHRNHLEDLVKTRTGELDQANEHLSQRVEWLSFVTGIHLSIKGEDSLETVYAELSTKIMELLDPELLFILRWKNQALPPEIYTCSFHGSAIPDQELLVASFSSDSSLYHELVAGKFISYQADQESEISPALNNWLTEQQMPCVIVVPMIIGQSFIGALGIAAKPSRRDNLLSQKDLIERMALDLASLTQDAILLDKTLELVALDERNRLARDLHDSVTQVLFTATLLTEVLPQIWRRDPEQGFQTLDKLRRLTRGALAEMRTMLIELRPSAVLTTSLSELLAQLTEAITSRSGVPFHLFIEQIPLLPDEVQMNFYRIAQEALNNVVKHAQAMHVDVSLSETVIPATFEGEAERAVRLEILDDGVGFSTASEHSGHLGISIMRERAAAIHATLTLESQPGHGTRVTLVWSTAPKMENSHE